MISFKIRHHWKVVKYCPLNQKQHTLDILLFDIQPKKEKRKVISWSPWRWIRGSQIKPWDELITSCRSEVIKKGKFTMCHNDAFSRLKEPDDISPHPPTPADPKSCKSTFLEGTQTFFNYVSNVNCTQRN